MSQYDLYQLHKQWYRQQLITDNQLGSYLWTECQSELTWLTMIEKHEACLQEPQDMVLVHWVNLPIFQRLPKIHMRRLQGTASAVGMEHLATVVSKSSHSVLQRIHSIALCIHHIKHSLLVLRGFSLALIRSSLIHYAEKTINNSLQQKHALVFHCCGWGEEVRLGMQSQSEV